VAGDGTNTVELAAKTAANSTWLAELRRVGPGFRG
jgi:hypothetical protein